MLATLPEAPYGGPTHVSITLAGCYLEVCFQSDSPHVLHSWHWSSWLNRLRAHAWRHPCRLSYIRRCTPASPSVLQCTELTQIHTEINLTKMHEINVESLAQNSFPLQIHFALTLLSTSPSLQHISLPLPHFCGHQYTASWKGLDSQAPHSISCVHCDCPLSSIHQ